MSSLIEKMSTLKRIQMQSNEELVIEVIHRGIKMSELIFSVYDIEYQASTGKANVKANVFNTNGFGEQVVVTVKYVSE